MPSPNIWIAASDNDLVSISQFLSQNPSSVNSRDENGYTPIHAAASYNHIPLLKSLIRSHGGDVNITDHDGDTPLFAAETVETARCLVEELGADLGHRNEAGLTAAEAIEDDEQFPLVAAYLRERETPAATTNGASSSSSSTRPPPPEGVEVSYSTMEESSEMDAPVDSELRQRIEELAQRGDFEGEEAQRELRELVAGALRDHVVDHHSEGDRNVRTRQDDP
ncbi:ankyrin repeat-containing domain protein [Trichophaea hybrida]|nr:ankyrin repeat-containing domain protein [Trichophaea hybrida]